MLHPVVKRPATHPVFAVAPVIRMVQARVYLVGREVLSEPWAMGQELEAQMLAEPAVHQISGTVLNKRPTSQSRPPTSCARYAQRHPRGLVGLLCDVLPAARKAALETPNILERQPNAPPPARVSVALPHGLPTLEQLSGRVSL